MKQSQLHSEDKKTCIALDVDEIDKNGISSNTSFAENRGKKLLCM